MKTALLLSLLLAYRASASDTINVQRIADAIYKIEGGKKTKYPYGVKSINTKHNAVKARIICINTIVNTHKRWIAENKPIDFLDYLANRYCPPTSDSIGNRRWRANIRKYVVN